MFEVTQRVLDPTPALVSGTQSPRVWLTLMPLRTRWEACLF